MGVSCSAKARSTDESDINPMNLCTETIYYLKLVMEPRTHKKTRCQPAPPHLSLCEQVLLPVSGGWKHKERLLHVYTFHRLYRHPFGRGRNLNHAPNDFSMLNFSLPARVAALRDMKKLRQLPGLSRNLKQGLRGMSMDWKLLQAKLSALLTGETQLKLALPRLCLCYSQLEEEHKA